MSRCCRGDAMHSKSHNAICCHIVGVDRSTVDSVETRPRISGGVKWTMDSEFISVV